MSIAAPQIPDMEIFDEVGRGARNVVFRARRRGRMVALKVPRFREDLEAIAADYRREAALQAQVVGASLPEVYEVGTSEGLPYLVTELLTGDSLAQRLQKGPLGADDALHLALDLAATLAVIHEHALVHRDLKPANILMTDSSRARLIDFGLATRSHLGGGTAVTGTFRYSAPEQTGMLDRPLDGRADLYALGVVLFECLAGRPPFVADDPGELIRLHAVASPPDLARLAPQASSLMCETIRRLMAKDPDDRFASAAQLLGF